MLSQQRVLAESALTNTTTPTEKTVLRPPTQPTAAAQHQVAIHSTPTTAPLCALRMFLPSRDVLCLPHLIGVVARMPERPA